MDCSLNLENITEIAEELETFSFTGAGGERVARIMGAEMVHNETRDAERFIALAQRGGCGQVRKCVMLEPANEYEQYDSVVVAYIEARDAEADAPRAASCLGTSADTVEVDSSSAVPGAADDEGTSADDTSTSNATSNATWNGTSDGNISNESAGVSGEDDTTNETNGSSSNESAARRSLLEGPIRRLRPLQRPRLLAGVWSASNDSNSSPDNGTNGSFDNTTSDEDGGAEEHIMPYQHHWGLSVDDAHVELRGEFTDRMYVIGELQEVAKSLRGLHIEGARTMFDAKGLQSEIRVDIDITVKSLGRLFSSGADGEEDPVALFNHLHDVAVPEDREHWYYPLRPGETLPLVTSDPFYTVYHGPEVAGGGLDHRLHKIREFTDYQKRVIEKYRAEGGGAASAEQSSVGNTTMNGTTMNGTSNASDFEEQTNETFPLQMIPGVPMGSSQKQNHFPAIARKLRMEFRRLNRAPYMDAPGDVYFESRSPGEAEFMVGMAVQIKDLDVQTVDGQSNSNFQLCCNKVKLC